MSKNLIRVGSAVVIENENGEILLTKSKKPPVKGMWVLPSGGVNFGETAKDAAKREIKEETGLEIKVGDLLTMYELIQPKNNVHKVIFYHKAKPIGGKVHPTDDISELIWVKPSEIKRMKDVAYTVLEILEKAKYF